MANIITRPFYRVDFALDSRIRKAYFISALKKRQNIFIFPLDSFLKKGSFGQKKRSSTGIFAGLWLMTLKAPLHWDRLFFSIVSPLKNQCERR
jgi:hypothetical protein